MKKIILCGHTGSHNRGCEAIIKSTADIFHQFNCDTVLATHDLPYDRKVGVKEFSDIQEYVEFRNSPFLRATSLFIDRVLHLQYIANLIRQKNVFKSVRQNIALNVGGDTYCYDTVPKVSINLNRHCNNTKTPCVLWGCSIEKDKINQPLIREDLSRYSMILPRESTTYEYLINSGFPQEKLLLMADPAFTLAAEPSLLPSQFIEGNTVGINLSPLVLEWSKNPNLVMGNYTQVIDWILSNTDTNVCFIPHVYRTEEDYDMIPHTKLYDIYKHTGRVSMINDTNLSCKQLKYIISKCRFMITARTHASIAAYSSLIPTLVLGYSIKSIGISKDLFGTDSNYVVSVDKLQDEGQLLSAFRYITDNEQNIKSILAAKVPEMQSKVHKAAQTIVNLYASHD